MAATATRVHEDTSCDALWLILARDERGGIGKNGGLPWPQSDLRARADSLWFKAVTSSIPDETYTNVVIMGRATWDSLPPSVKPLRGRVNVVLTSSPESFALENRSSSVTAKVRVPVAAATLDEGMAMGRAKALSIGKHVHRYFCIGGRGVYDAALDECTAGRCEKAFIIATKMDDNFDCDVEWDTFMASADGGVVGSRHGLAGRVSAVGMSSVAKELSIREELPEHPPGMEVTLVEVSKKTGA